MASEDLFTSLDRDPQVAFALDRTLRIVYCNSAWDIFAVENGGAAWQRPASLGQPLLDVIPERLKGLYSTAYRQVLFSGTPWVHHYECSSPTVYRMFRMTVTRAPDSQHLTVVNFLMNQATHGATRHGIAPGEMHRGPGGAVTMCCVCRRTLHVPEGRWEWVPDFVQAPPDALVHGLCDPCARSCQPK